MARILTLGISSSVPKRDEESGALKFTKLEFSVALEPGDIPMDVIREAAQLLHYAHYGKEGDIVPELGHRGPVAGAVVESAEEVSQFPVLGPPPAREVSS